MSNKHYPYTEADIRRYLDGGMSRAEMHRLELAALDDPFLQDALDGYTAAMATEDPAKIQEIVNDLRKFKPNKNTRKYRNVIIPSWQKNVMQYAAAAMLVGLGGWYIFNIPEKQGVTTSRQEVPSNPMVDTVKVGVPLVTPQPKSGIPKLVKKDDLAFSPNPEAKAEKKVEPAPSISTPEEKITPSETVSTSQASSSPLTETAKGNLLAATPVTVKGKVTDTDEYPLDNITIRVKESGTETVTDELGRFNLKLPDSNATIIASGPGYKTKELTGLPDHEKLELKLERSTMSLDEAVVTGLSKQRPSFAPETDTSEAVPAGGWKNFISYVEQNKKMKSTGKKAQQVILSFEIDKNGRPAEFEVLQSVGKMHDEEAIRLLQDGPSWINKTKNPSPLARVTIIF